MANGVRRRADFGGDGEMTEYGVKPFSQLGGGTIEQKGRETLRARPGLPPAQQPTIEDLHIRHDAASSISDDATG